MSQAVVPKFVSRIASATIAGATRWNLCLHGFSFWRQGRVHLFVRALTPTPSFRVAVVRFPSSISLWDGKPLLIIKPRVIRKLAWNMTALPFSLHYTVRSFRSWAHSLGARMSAKFLTIPWQYWNLLRRRHSPVSPEADFDSLYTEFELKPNWSDTASGRARMNLQDFCLRIFWIVLWTLKTLTYFDFVLRLHSLLLDALSSSLSGPSGGCLAEIRRKFRAGVTSGQCCQWTAWVPEPSPNWCVDLCGQVPTTHILDSRKRSNWWGAQLPVPVVHSFLRTSVKSFGFTRHVDKAHQSSKKQFVNQVPILTAMILQGHVHCRVSSKPSMWRMAK